MVRKEHNLEDEYHCVGLQETQNAVENLVEWQKRQNGSLERVEKKLNDIYDTLLSDAREATRAALVAAVVASRVSKLTLVVVGLLVLDLLVHVGPDIAGRLVRAILGSL